MHDIAQSLDRLEQRVGHRGYVAVIVLLITLFSFFFAFPDEILMALFGHLRTTEDGRFVSTFIPLSIDPWHTTFSEPAWEAFRHRILGPLIAWCVGLRGRSSAIVPMAANPLIYLVSFNLLRRKTSASAAFVITVILSLTLACATSQSWLGYQDSLATLFLLLAMACSSPIISALWMLVGMLADERILAAAGLVVLWHCLESEVPDKKWRGFFVRSLCMTGALAMWCIYMVGQKHFYGTDFHAIMSAVHYSFLNSKSYIWPGWYYGLRGGWILPAAAVAWWIVSKQYGKAALLMLGIAPIFGIGLQVEDISRVSSFAFPALLISAVALYRIKPATTENLLVAALIVQSCSPIMTVVMGQCLPIQPLPSIVGRYLFEHPAVEAPIKPVGSPATDLQAK